MQAKVCLFLAAALFSLSVYGQERGNLGIGYDEGLAAKYYFTDRMGAEVSLGLEYLGGYDATANNNGGQDPETNGSFGAAFLFSVFKSQHAYLDIMAQMAYAHDDTRDPNDVGDRDWGFLRMMWVTAIGAFSVW
ncbi:MAG: hypothetical protein A2268_11865 [Candidatus Raymondbacteria bacterium RifOxyA12_full_50_37]|uniref:Outer membrane protein beta-barrel domain-containing protein n=1 Tax=Candidatus Raymondbacteria bacterium RIFOXYD12_FULL_49_13 TaxID=1817890 RepID=A0A1F7FJT4_UNCRA|nr:MAG: hypothetical protein A2268_11865 [Candidatus Raymondbacteria bacterium RifOxyA12_full_50_37]OGJ91725.1 MAG: hypothetical protein A2248_13790 [Candidatus Raymondbacteria bacterium RIFOXYA2_FULL_49_16]OGK03928.1 MAG: hypothetical protein A2350_15020 [Candidatus Raymondbacteria bacterium RifOxyB12_full_50_8]OGK06975.1 MAG: hypothetical protein A2519_17375 [Candidatus Raymondbacteria bacterium RIFOXYD12_FULL_49_13]OGP43916.1 MAG: hypothetical protein A2324_00395 [Candidatus Raymondbacteria 